MFGPTVISSANLGTTISVDGKPEAKADGITIDWTTVTAAGSDTTLPDGTVVPAGEKFLAAGQTVVRLTSVVVTGSTIGMYGPFDPAATDGRQTLADGGDNYVLGHAARQSDPRGQHPQAVYGGLVWAARILNAGGGTHTLAAGPTLAEIKSTFPRLQLYSGN